MTNTLFPTATKLYFSMLQTSDLTELLSFLALSISGAHQCQAFMKKREIKIGRPRDKRWAFGDWAEETHKICMAITKETIIIKSFRRNVKCHQSKHADRSV